jgi:hypothetical protein
MAGSIGVLNGSAVRAPECPANPANLVVVQGDTVADQGTVPRSTQYECCIHNMGCSNPLMARAFRLFCVFHTGGPTLGPHRRRFPAVAGTLFEPLHNWPDDCQTDWAQPDPR